MLRLQKEPQEGIPQRKTKSQTVDNETNQCPGQALTSSLQYIYHILSVKHCIVQDLLSVNADYNRRNLNDRKTIWQLVLTSTKKEKQGC